MLDNHEHKHAVHEFDGIIENQVSKTPVYFTVLFYGLIIWGVAFMSFYLLSGWSSQAEFQEKMAAHKGEQPVKEQAASPTPVPAAAKAPAAVVEADGQTLFKKHCAGCHGANGKGAFGPDLSGEYKYGKTTMAVQESIAYGRPKNMPGFEQKLSQGEIEALTEFILSL
jgi:cytochrome c oxidase cbb3-type subunit 3